MRGGGRAEDRLKVVFERIEFDRVNGRVFVLLELS